MTYQARNNLAADAAAQASFTLLSDTAGKITRIGVKIPVEVIDLPNQVYKYEPLKHAAYDALLKRLAATGMSITAVARKDHVQAVEKWLNSVGFTGRCQIQPAPEAKYNICGTWARDCLICATYADGTRALVHPRTSLDGDLASWFSEALNTSPVELSFLLDGGSSLVVDDQTWIVGAEAIQNVMENDGGVTWNDQIQTIATGMGRTPIIAGFQLQDVRSPLRFVRDRFVRIARKRRRHGIENANWMHRFLATIHSGLSAAISVVRDLFTRGMLYSQDIWSHIDTVVSVTGVSRNGKSVLLVADPTLPECPPPPTDKDYREIYDELVSELKGVVSTLQAANCFEIIPIPAPFVEGTMLAYANTIVQKDIVLIPAFSGSGQDFTKANQKNLDIWNGLVGPNVVQVPGWYAFKDDQGCIRCATLQLDREL